MLNLAICSSIGYCRLTADLADGPPRHCMATKVDMNTSGPTILAAATATLRQSALSLTNALRLISRYPINFRLYKAWRYHRNELLDIGKEDCKLPLHTTCGSHKACRITACCCISVLALRLHQHFACSNCMCVWKLQLVQSAVRVLLMQSSVSQSTSGVSSWELTGLMQI